MEFYHRLKYGSSTALLSDLSLTREQLMRGCLKSNPVAKRKKIKKWHHSSWQEYPSLWCFAPLPPVLSPCPSPHTRSPKLSASADSQWNPELTLAWVLTDCFFAVGSVPPSSALSSTASFNSMARRASEFYLSKNTNFSIPLILWCQNPRPKKKNGFANPTKKKPRA